jgi:hypothetical protein
MSRELKLLVTKFSLELTTRYIRKSQLAAKDSAKKSLQAKAVSYH